MSRTLKGLQPTWERYGRSVPGKVRRRLVRQLKTEELFTHETARMMTSAFGYVGNQKVVGDYAEFGVFKGRAFIEAWDAARRYGSDAHLYAFDSFQGLPELSGTDREGIWHAGEYAATTGEFQQALRRRRVPGSRVTIVEGFFEDTLKAEHRGRVPLERVAIAWIDCDLYASNGPRSRLSERSPGRRRRRRVRRLVPLQGS